jgi:hypothetical protein
MMQQIENVISAFAQLAVACTLGLSLAIGVAGITNSSMPLKCLDCSPTMALATDTAVRRT